MWTALRSLPGIVPSQAPALPVLDGERGVWLSVPPSRGGLGAPVVDASHALLVIRRRVEGATFTIQVETAIFRAGPVGCGSAVILARRGGPTGPVVGRGTIPLAPRSGGWWNPLNWPARPCFGVGSVRFDAGFDPSVPVWFGVFDANGYGTADAIAQSGPVTLAGAGAVYDEEWGTLGGLSDLGGVAGEIGEAVEDAVTLTKWLAFGALGIAVFAVAGPYITGATRNARSTYDAARGR